MQNLTNSSVFVCSTCCYFSTYAVPISDTFSLPLVSVILSGIWVVLMAAMLVRMSQIYHRGLSQGYQFVQSPVAAIRASEKEKKMYIPSFYFSYVVLNGLFTIIEVMGALPDESPALDWIWKFLCGAREAVDAALVIFLCLPRLTRFTKWIPLVGSLVVLVVFSVFVSLVPEHEPCPWCTQHFPKSSVSWLFLVESFIVLLIAILAKKRPFKHNPRPAAFLLCVFWWPIYASLGTVLPIMRANYPLGDIDWGFCSLFVIITIYYLLYVVIVYAVIIQDSKYIFALGLDDSLQVKRSPQYELLDESTERLVRKYPMSELVELLQERSLVAIPSSELTLTNRVGAGAFGEVYKANWNGTEVAVKSLLRFSESELTSFVKEMSLLSRLRHPNILLLLGMVLEEDTQSLISEFCTRGSLFDAIHEPQLERLTAKQRKSIAYGTAAGMEYLHSKGIVHRDLKPGNILLTSDCHVRIADFGLSRDLQSAGSMTGLGTVLYAAPEMLKQDLHGKSADVWSYGVILWELWAEKLPYGDGFGVGKIVLGIVSNTLHLDYDLLLPGTPDPMVECMKHCTVFEPEGRMEFSDILLKIK